MSTCLWMMTSILPDKWKMYEAIFELAMMCKPWIDANPLSIRGDVMRIEACLVVTLRDVMSSSSIMQCSDVYCCNTYVLYCTVDVVLTNVTMQSVTEDRNYYSKILWWCLENCVFFNPHTQDEFWIRALCLSAHYICFAKTVWRHFKQAKIISIQSRGWIVSIFWLMTCWSVPWIQNDKVLFGELCLFQSSTHNATWNLVLAW